uniref:Amine oxidase domain-containing protein n=1 Tax=viral metagenome TaxID=1070528 RepID=A0A6C0DC41_9ZZZZ
MYDVVIVGGGISGLYSAYKIKKRFPRINILILERNREGYLGGRTGNDMFEGEKIVTGAGIGRKHKDKILIKLLKELEIKTHEFITGPNYANTIIPQCDVKDVFLNLKKQYNHDIHGNMTFKQYATSIIGKVLYKQFVVCAGYTDYEEESAYETLYQYGFDDNYNTWTGIHIPWDTLVEKLARKIGLGNILYSQSVQNIRPIKNGNDTTYVIDTKTSQSKTDRFEAKHVIIATTIEPLKKMLPGAASKNSVYQQIHSQPFIRIYGKFSKKSIDTMKSYVPGLLIVPGPLHKIISINPNKGVYMIAYSDNAPATLLHKYAKNIKYNRDSLARLLEKSIGIPNNTLELESISEYYWSEGTHYFDPLRGIYKSRDYFLKIAQHPSENMWVVGEMVSKNQGWVEGALESVEAVIGEVLKSF